MDSHSLNTELWIGLGPKTLTERRTAERPQWYPGMNVDYFLPPGNSEYPCVPVRLFKYRSIVIQIHMALLIPSYI